MEPTVKMVERVMYPISAFIEPSENLEASVTQSFGDQESLEAWSWSTSQHNPKNRVDSLSPMKPSTWRVDDAQADGHRLFVLPDFAIGKPPLRIDAYLSDQDGYDLSPELRRVLRPEMAILAKSKQVGRVPMSLHILRALHSWMSRVSDFEEQYWSMPFGSYIAVGSIRADIRNMEFHLVPSYQTEGLWFSTNDLQAEWAKCGEVVRLPEALEISELHLLEQPHEAISIVKIPRLTNDKRWIFKSILNEVKYMYHELWMLLKMALHSNIIQRPAYIITKQGRFGGKNGVCGFILEYYKFGTLRDALSFANLGLRPPPSLRDKLRWSREIVEGIMHINHECQSFFSGMKHVNIVMSESGRGQDLRPVIIDFEQRTGRYPWVPPEIYYINYLEYISESSATPPEIRARATALIQSYILGWKPESRKQGLYTFSPYGYSDAWRVLSSNEREGAQVYMLGKLMWYIFEVVGAINNGLNLETFRAEHCDISFPEFRKTPDMIRECIRSCTIGAAEWTGRFPRVVKARGKLWPRGRSGENGEVFGRAEETQQAARSWWTQELKDAEKFVMARKRQKFMPSGLAADRNLLAHMIARPSLRALLDMIKTEEALLEMTGS